MEPGLSLMEPGLKLVVNGLKLVVNELKLALIRELSMLHVNLTRIRVVLNGFDASS